MAAIPSFPEFDVEDPSNLAVRWEKYLKRFNNLVTAMNLRDAGRKRALLLHYVGERVNDIFDTLPDRGENNNFNAACDALTAYFTPKKNVSFEIFKFRKLQQVPGESIDEYHTRLQIAAKYCEFHDHDTEIKLQIELGTSSKKLRQHSFRHPSLTLTDLISYARTLAETEKQASGIANSSFNMPSSAEINAVNKDNSSPNDQRSQKPEPKQKELLSTSEQVPTRKCFRCGLAWPHKDQPCPAEGQQCNNCKKYNHFARVCRSTRRKQPSNEVRKIEQAQQQVESDDSDEYVYTLETPADKENFQKTLRVGNSEIPFQIDTGSTANIINETSYKHLVDGNPTITLAKSKKRLFGFASSTPLQVLGQFQCTLESSHKITTAKVFVVKNATGCLLSGHTAIELDLIHVKVNTVTALNSKEIPTRLTPLIQEYSDVFTGIGKLKNFKVHLHIDPSVKPVVQPTRRIPFAIRNRVEVELKHLEDSDIIEPTTGPTPWVSPIVVFPKPNQPDKIRLCVDMRMPNQAIQREHHPQPIIDDLITDLNGAKYFSKLDLSSAYHQLELDKDSRSITTFTTHKGLYRYKRLNFGTNSASEIFQNALDNVLNGIEGCRNISDDIIIFGKTEKDHDASLQKVLEVLKANNLKLGLAKCQFDKEQLEFFGYIFSADGISPSPSKVDAVKETPVPTNPTEVRSFLGMIQYCGRFIPNLATVSAPLRMLTQKDVKWDWTSMHQEAFETLKRLLTSDMVMGYFDPSKNTELHVDASPVGLGAILTQTTPGKDDTKVMAYASRSLTPVESWYSHIEKEALAILYGIEHFCLYLCGHVFTLITDNKPLELIYKNLQSRPSSRIERWCLCLQEYSFHVKYRPGPKNPSDYLSRHPCTATNTRNPLENVAEEHVCLLAENAISVICCYGYCLYQGCNQTRPHS
jgi:hypothetical protein